MTIVLTGAAGFIGSALLRHLNDLGMNHILLVDDLETSDKWKNLLQKQFKELISKDQLMKWLEGRSSEISAIIHLGACSDTLETNGDFLLENNTRYSMRLAEYALSHKIRFLYASSAATYGDGSRGFSDDHDVLEELRPLNLYGFSKHLFDLWLKREKLLDSVVGLKYFNIFGPNENHKGHMASMVYKMVPRVLTEGAISLYQSSDPSRYGDGEQKRDFLYVKDAAAMTASFLKNDKTGIFNVGRGESFSWNRLAKAVFSALKRAEKIDYIPMPAPLVKQYQNYTCAEMKKLPYSYQYSLEEAVEDYITNYLQKDRRW